MSAFGSIFTAPLIACAKKVLGISLTLIREGGLGMTGQRKSEVVSIPKEDVKDTLMHQWVHELAITENINHGAQKGIHKSSRHSKMTGDFAEHIVLYWLSKFGYECARIDHVGVDLIAHNPTDSSTIGISVKSRSREYDVATRAPGLMKDKDIQRLKETCSIFEWVPFVSFVIDSPDKMYIIMCSLNKYLSFEKTTFSFRPKDIAKYKCDPEMKIVEFNHVTSISKLVEIWLHAGLYRCPHSRGQYAPGHCSVFHPLIEMGLRLTTHKRILLWVYYRITFLKNPPYGGFTGIAHSRFIIYLEVFSVYHPSIRTTIRLSAQCPVGE